MKTSSTPHGVYSVVPRKKSFITAGEGNKYTDRPVGFASYTQR